MVKGPAPVVYYSCGSEGPARRKGNAMSILEAHERTLDEALRGDIVGLDPGCFIAPGPWRGANSTMVECVLLGEDYEQRRPQYGYRLSEITEGGPVVIFEGTDVHGPAMGAWSEAEDMALAILGFLCANPEDVGDGYGDSWTDLQREWNDSYGEGLDLIHYDHQTMQCEGEFSLSEGAALWAITEHAGLTWLKGGPDYYGDRQEFAAEIDALRAHHEAQRVH